MIAMKKLVLFIVFVYFIVNASALMFYSGECFNSGGARITVNAGDNDSKVYSSQMKTFIDGVEIEDGTWSAVYFRNSNDGSKKYGILETKEGLFNEQKKYNIEVSYYIENDSQKRTISGTMECPGLRFSCALLNLTVGSCYTENGKFVADLTVAGIAQSSGIEKTPEESVIYGLTAEKKYLDAAGNNQENGKLPAGYSITQVGKDRYTIEAPFVDNKVIIFYATLKLDEFIKYCDSKDYPEVSFFDKTECSSETQETVQQEQPIVKAPEETTEQEEEPVEPENVEPEEIVANTGNVGILVIISVVVIILVIVGLVYLRKKGQM